MTIGRVQYVRSVPGELSMDGNRLLEVAQVWHPWYEVYSHQASPTLWPATLPHAKGYVLCRAVQSQPGWPTPHLCRPRAIPLTVRSSHSLAGPHHTCHPTLPQAKGYLSRSEVESQPGWPPARFDAAVQMLLKQGVAMVDDQGPSGERLYWFPCTASGQAW